MKKKLLALMLTMTCILSLVGCDSKEVADVATDAVADVIEDTTDINENIAEDLGSEETGTIANETQGRDIIFGDLVIPAYVSDAYIEINGNEPFFTEDEIVTDVFETFADLDELGRCGVAYANVCPELMPTEDRGAIGQVKPSGWHTVKYDCVDGKYLYNRCHLIGFQLTGENANEENLITGTRYLNIDGMLDHENTIAEYVKETGNHVLYRVTPVYDGDNLVADGVVMEAYSVEDNGEGIKLCLFAYNVQPGVQIDYATGDSALTGEEIVADEPVLKNYTENPDGIIYIVNTETKKFHYEDCSTAVRTKEENKESYNGTVDWLLDNGYTPCGKCKPQ